MIHNTPSAATLTASECHDLDLLPFQPKGQHTIDIDFADRNPALLLQAIYNRVCDSHFTVHSYSVVRFNGYFRVTGYERKPVRSHTDKVIRTTMHRLGTDIESAICRWQVWERSENIETLSYASLCRDYAQEEMIRAARRAASFAYNFYIKRGI